MQRQIYPSILSADFSKLGEEITAAQNAGANGIHIDVMDGHFVPNLTLGAPILKKIKKTISTVADCHLMVNNPDTLIQDFIDAGADVITVHQEACTHLHRTLNSIKSAGLQAGVSLNPATSFKDLEYVLENIDLILIMSVNPGFGGQSFIPSCFDKIKNLKNWLIQKKANHISIQVDGGVNSKTKDQLWTSGCDIAVAGSAVFSTDDYKKAIEGLRS